MSRQFSLVATDLDLLELENLLKLRADVTFYSSNAKPGTLNLIPLESIVLDPKNAGAQSLFCFLVPKKQQEIIYVERFSEVKVGVNVKASNLIDFWRPYYDGKLIKAGRMYYTEKFLENSEFVDKSAEFCQWAGVIMRGAKKLLHRDADTQTYWGKDAMEKFKNGTLTVKI